MYVFICRSIMLGCSEASTSGAERIWERNNGPQLGQATLAADGENGIRQPRPQTL